MKIDTTKIEGFDSMSESEKLNALLEFDSEPAGSDELTKLKALLSKANSEAATYKKQMREKMSEQEQAEASRQEKERELLDELNALRAEKQIANLKANYLSIGYSDELASKAASAFHAGDVNSVFKIAKMQIEAHEQEVRSKLVSSTPTPVVGGAVEKGMTKEAFGKLSYAERGKLYAENKDLYEQMANENENGG